jgi:hypothetical protein
MLMLYNGQALEGDADAASLVNYTIMGTTGGIDQVLAQGQLGTSAASLVTAAASVSVDISAIYLKNTDSSLHYVSLYVDGGSGTNTLISFTLQPKATAVYEAGRGWVVYSADGVVQGPTLSY